MHLQSALEGNLTEVLARERGGLADRLRAGVTEASTGLKQELRGQVTGAGMGERLARTWQDKIYPPRRVGAPARPAAAAGLPAGRAVAVGGR